jgi:hypothetical protein
VCDSLVQRGQLFGGVSHRRCGVVGGAVRNHQVTAPVRPWSCTARRATAPDCAKREAAKSDRVLARQ